jgi:mRNA interferase RelE/StbE
LPWTIEYQNATKKQLKRLDPSVRTRIFDFLDERVARDSGPYSVGRALTGPWRGHWRYRVGDYRVICRLRNTQMLVLVVKVGHRSDVYESAPDDWDTPLMGWTK